MLASHPLSRLAPVQEFPADLAALLSSVAKLHHEPMRFAVPAIDKKGNLTFSSYHSVLPRLDRDNCSLGLTISTEK